MTIWQSVIILMETILQVFEGGGNLVGKALDFFLN